MKLPFLLSCLVVIQAQDGGQTNSGVCVNDIYYHDKIVLSSGLNSPSQLNLDEETNTLFFCTHHQKFKFCRLNLTNGEIKNIESIPRGLSNDIDTINKIVYVGTNKGIYTYDILKDTSQFYAADKKRITGIQFKDGSVYYTTRQSELGNFYVYSNGETKKVKHLEDNEIHRFLIDNDGDITYHNATGLNLLKNGEDTPNKFDKNVLWNQLSDIAADSIDQIYAVFEFGDDGIYKVKKDKLTLEKIVDGNHGAISSVTFDSKHIMMFSDSKGIYKLVANTTVQCPK